MNRSERRGEQGLSQRREGPGTGSNIPTVRYTTTASHEKNGWVGLDQSQTQLEGSSLVRASTGGVAADGGCYDCGGAERFLPRHRLEPGRG